MVSLKVQCNNSRELKEVMYALAKVHERQRLREYHRQAISTEELETLLLSEYVKDYDFIGINDHSNQHFGKCNIWEVTLYNDEIIIVYQKL